MAQARKLDVWKVKDRQEIEKLPCAFCGECKIHFVSSSGYEAHFSDSDFDCLNCGCSYPVGLFFPDKTLEECKEMMRRRAAGHYEMLKKSCKEKLEDVERLRNQMIIYESSFNPSKRDKVGK